MMELREKKEALRKEFSQINNDCFEVFNDWGSTDPTWNYTHWLENKLLSINTPKHETVEKWEERTGFSFHDSTSYTCPICGNISIKESNAYCSCCGNKITDFDENHGKQEEAR